MKLFNQPKYPDSTISHLYNLYKMAKVDHRYHPKERRLFARMVKDSRIPYRHLKPYLSGRTKVVFAKPQTPSEQIEQIYDLMAMMEADGKSESSERDLCRAFARKMGIARHMVRPVMDHLSKLKALGYDKDDITAKVLKWLSQHP